MIQSKQEIIALCKFYRIRNYTINPDGSIDVDGNVYLNIFGLTELPLQFNKVSGDFDCGFNRLTSLKGAPEYVSGVFFCSDNKLISLDGAPKYIGEIFWCHMNPLEESKENLEILSRYNYDLDYYKECYPISYDMIIAAKRLTTINNILQ